MSGLGAFLVITFPTPPPPSTAMIPWALRPHLRRRGECVRGETTSKYSIAESWKSLFQLSDPISGY